MLFKTCPHCGANLDPGERCECEAKEKEQKESDQEKTEEKNNEKLY